MSQERPSPGQVALLAGVALALVGGLVLYRHSKGGLPFGLRAEQPSADPEPARVLAPPTESAAAREPFLAGDLQADRAEIRLGLFYLETPSTRPDDRFRAIHAAELRRIPLVDRIDSFTASPALAIASPRVEDYPPPTKELVPLVTHGLSASQMAALPEARAVLAVRAVASKGDGFRTLRDVSLLAATVAKETGAVICDGHTGECFGEAAWRAQRIAGWTGDIPSLDRHIVVRAYRDGELHRAVSLGMAQFGLPDVIVESFPASLSNEVASLVNLVCQTLLERGRIETPGRLTVDVDALAETDFKKTLVQSVRPNAQRRAEIRIAVAKRGDGNPDNRLIEILFPEPEGRGLAERQETLIARLFGSSDTAAAVEHDEEILAASKRAQGRLALLEPVFHRGLAPGERLLVKGPFKTSTGATEWMWIEVVRWQGATIRGVLMNDPTLLPGLKAGAEVEVQVASVFDYLHTLPDGGTEGNETGEIMQRRAPPKP